MENYEKVEVGVNRKAHKKFMCSIFKPFTLQERDGYLTYNIFFLSSKVITLFFTKDEKLHWGKLHWVVMALDGKWGPAGEAMLTQLKKEANSFYVNVSSFLINSPTSAWWNTTIDMGSIRRHSCVVLAATPKPWGRKKLLSSNISYTADKQLLERLNRHAICSIFFDSDYQ